MRSYLFLFFLLSSVFSLSAQNMDPELLYDVIKQEADTVAVNGNQFQFLYNEAMLICIYDEMPIVCES